jgi:hypothetical protein
MPRGGAWISRALVFNCGCWFFFVFLGVIMWQMTPIVRLMGVR